MPPIFAGMRDAAGAIAPQLGATTFGAVYDALLDDFEPYATTAEVTQIFDELKAELVPLIAELRETYTIVIVTHNMQQAARVSDYTAYMYLGELIEFGETDQIFLRPSRRETEDYITGRFG